MPRYSAAKIRCVWEEFRNGCVEIRGPGIGGSGVKTEAARDVAISKSFSAGARIAIEDANNLFTSLSNIKAMRKKSAKSRKVRRPCYETYDSSDPTSVGVTGVHQRASRQQNDWKPPARRSGGRIHRVGETAGSVAARSV